MAFEVPHKHDISLDGQDMRNQMIENFEAIQQEDKNDDQALSDEVTDRKKGDGNLQGQINKLQERCQKLEQEKATKDDLETVKSELLGRVKSIYMGKDSKAIRDIILDMKEKGEI
ncbi:hypothetical protein DT304_00145 [Lactobacillus reuteri]|uniref:hypothetical protein n=1 Tax=Limosilactobacillus reuteri TaxID=1598 RepID=UPI001651DAA4|nr:hypothetical protein [Limosilactobacillus reuteri]MBC6909747.1 hypothetical protein [Limosilactobacillus reuteri]